MKLQILKLLPIIICLFIFEQTLMAQSNKLKMHAISIGPGFASSSSETADGGISLNLDIATILNNHIISFNFNTGLELNSNGPDEDFFELNLTYGQKWFLAKNLYFEGHVGMGLFGYHIDQGQIPLFIDVPETTIGFPIRAKLIFYPLKNFGVGLNPNLNINSIANTYSAFLIFQYNFN